jgi:hypothetical protein
MPTTLIVVRHQCCAVVTFANGIVTASNRRYILSPSVNESCSSDLRITDS